MVLNTYLYTASAMAMSSFSIKLSSYIDLTSSFTKRKIFFFSLKLQVVFINRLELSLNPDSETHKLYDLGQTDTPPEP